MKNHTIQCYTNTWKKMNVMHNPQSYCSSVLLLDLDLNKHIHFFTSVFVCFLFQSLNWGKISGYLLFTSNSWRSFQIIDLNVIHIFHKLAFDSSDFRSRSQQHTDLCLCAFFFNLYTRWNQAMASYFEKPTFLTS